MRSILEEQAVANLHSLHANEYSYPAHVRLSSGSAQVNSSGGLSGFHNIVPTGDNGRLAATMSRSWTTNWSVAPVTDPLELDRLHVLYRLAIERARLGPVGAEVDDPAARTKADLAKLATALSRVFKSCTGQNCVPASEERYRALLLSLFGPRPDEMGRPTNLDWEFVVQNVTVDGRTIDAVALHDGRLPKFIAREVQPDEQWSDLLTRLRLLPFAFLTFEKGKLLIDRKTHGFRAFVNLTQQPDLSHALVVGDKNEEFLLVPGGRKELVPFQQMVPILDPSR